MKNYAHPEVVVTTDWVEKHKADPNVLIAEVNVDTSLYDKGHIPNAIGWSWETELCDTIQRDIASKKDIEQLLGKAGTKPDTTIILYGDSNNWFAAWAFWQLKIYGHKDVRMMDGGRKKWMLENKAITKEVPSLTPTEYRAKEADFSLRAFLPEVQKQISKKAVELVDVRSPDEFTGKILAPPGLPETCQRGGHIPGASNIPWSMAVNDEDGTFKSREELEHIYSEAGITGSKPVITYCRIGERSSHSWLVLKYLLGYENIKNYDGSWTEWGNLVGASVERGEQKAVLK